MTKNQKKHDYREKNTSYKAHWAIFLVLAILCIGSVSAELLTFDNVKRYDEETKTVIIVNTFGLGRDIADIKLETPLRVKLPVGYQKVAEFTLNSFDDEYTDAFDKMEFYSNLDSKEIKDKQFDYKYLTTELYDVNDYEETCSEIIIKGTTGCTSEIVGTHQEEREIWKDLDTSKILKGEYKIGIFTQVNIGDDVEWIPTLFGKEINEWASYVQSSGSITTHDVGGVNYTTYLFTSNGYFNTTVELNASVLVVAGGGGSGRGDSGGGIGGGGAGGLLWENAHTISVGDYNVFIGAGGAGATSSGDAGVNGVNSSFDTMIAIGGGGGGHGNGAGVGIDGGSAGGGGFNAAGGTGSQGNNGGAGVGEANNAGGGGGGAGTVGADATTTVTGAGGAGLSYTIYNGTALWYAGGGGGGSWDNAADVGGLAGIGGGGVGDGGGAIDGATNGVANTGGGAGGVSQTTNGKAGGSGIVIIRVKTSELSDPDSNPIVTLNTPANTTNFTSNSIVFGGIVTDDINLINVSLIIDDVYIETNVSGINNSNYTFTDTFADGDYTWNYEACDNSSQCTNGTARTFSIDTTVPAVLILSPGAIINSHVLNTNYTLNWSANDTHLDACVYQYEGINHTLSCSDNTTEFNITNTANRTIILYVNDTFGNWNITTITWDYNFIETGSSFTASVFETMNYSFALNVTSYQTLTSFSAFLDHNGTTYSADSTCTSGNCEITAIIDIPLITKDSTTENKTFFWRLSIFNGTATTNINTSTNTQIVTAVNFVECNTIPFYANISSVNFTTHKEVDRTALATTLNAQFEYYLGTGTETKFGNSSQTGASVYEYCIDQNESFFTTSNIDLSATSYEDRHYDLINQRYTNITTIQPLYLLNSTLASNIIIEVKDQGLIPQVGIIVNISRFYPGDGKYVPVEIQMTDEFGQILAKLVENDAKYRFNFYNENGDLLKTSPDITIACRNAFCVVPFVIEDTTDDFDRFENLTTYTSSLSFDNTTNIFTFGWDDQRGEAATTRLEVTRWRLNSSSIVCNTSSTSILSTLSCSVGDERASYKAQVFRTADGRTLRIALLNISVGDPSSTYGLEGLLWVFILLFTCVGIGAFNPTVGAVLYGAGFVMMGVVGIISMPVPVFFANVLLVILFIWGVNK